MKFDRIWLMLLRVSKLAKAKIEYGFGIGKYMPLGVTFISLALVSML